MNKDSFPFFNVILLWLFWLSWLIEIACFVWFTWLVWLSYICYAVHISVRSCKIPWNLTCISDHNSVLTWAYVNRWPNNIESLWNYWNILIFQIAKAIIFPTLSGLWNAALVLKNSWHFAARYYNISKEMKMPLFFFLLKKSYTTRTSYFLTKQFVVFVGLACVVLLAWSVQCFLRNEDTLFFFLIKYNNHIQQIQVTS